jgi:hypothetical protein
MVARLATPVQRPLACAVGLMQNNVHGSKMLDREMRVA